MKFTGKIAGINVDWQTGQYTVTFTCNEPAEIRQNYDTLKNLELLDICAVKYRKKRSLDANAYYWQLLTKLAEKVHVSKGRMHNMILRKYGQREYIDGKIVTMPIPDTDSAEDTALEAETYHIKPTSQVKEGKDGQMYRTYVMLRGSSSYDSREMSELIDGLVSDCKEMGIETLPPDEVERMLKAWQP